MLERIKMTLPELSKEEMNRRMKGGMMGKAQRVGGKMADFLMRKRKKLAKSK